MATDAKVRSIDELEAFRAGLIVFQNRARKAIDQASDEVRRTRLWIETDRIPHYSALVKKLTQRLEQAEGELMSARMSEFIDNPTVQQQAVRKAKAALQAAEEKLKAVKHWSRAFESTVQPTVKKLEGVTQFIDYDIPQAIIHMAQLIRALDAYAERSPVLSTPPATTAEEAGSSPA